jgi:DNA adenine methylase
MVRKKYKGMILRRLGNKKKIAKKIQSYFPKHKIYIEPFFGAGGMFFNKPKAKYNIVNDLDSDVFNLFQVVMNQKEELEKAFYMMPIHSDLLKHWIDNKEIEPIRKALRFLLLSNLTYMGAGATIKFGASGGYQHIKKSFKKELKDSYNLLFDVQFNNCHFKRFIDSISLDDRGNKKESEQTFIYCDPPYLQTGDNYSNSFTESDSLELFETLQSTGCKWAMSEFNHPFILEQAKQRGLNIIEIGERQNLKNRRLEILITNYQNRQTSLF